MATKQGSRYGEEKGIQRNKDNAAGDRKPNRSPGQSNANRVLPSPKENVGASQRADVERMKKGVSPTGSSALTRSAQQQAGGRALLRTMGRGAGLAGAAMLGYEGAKAIGEYMTERGEKKYAERQQKKREAEAELKRESNRGKPAAEMKKAEPAPMPKKTTSSGGTTAFGKAFKEARSAGKETFMFGGNKYHTKTKEEMKKK